MAGARRMHRDRSSSPSLAGLERRRSSSGNSGSSSGRGVRKRRRRSGSSRSAAAADARSCGNHGRGERELRDRSDSRRRGSRRGRSRIEQELISRAGADEKGRMSSSVTRRGFEGKRRGRGDDEKSPSYSDGFEKDIKQQRRKRKQHEEQHYEKSGGDRRRCSLGRNSSKYEEGDGHQDRFSSREREGRSSKCDSSSKRYESSSRRHENSSPSSSGKYDSQYSHYNNRSARGEDDTSSSRRYEERNNNSSSRYAYNNSSRYTGTGSGREDRDRSRHEVNDNRSSNHGEGGGSIRGSTDHNSRYMKSTGSKHGMPTNSSGYSESNATTGHSGNSSTRYAKNCSSSRCGGQYGSGYTSREAIESERDRMRWGRRGVASSSAHAAGIQDAGERRQRNQRFRCNKSVERDLSTGERTGRGREGVGAAHQEGRRGREEGSAGYDETAESGSERRRRSMDVDEDGLCKRQKLHAGAAATIGSRASFLRSNASNASRVGGSSSLYETERDREGGGKDTRAAAGRRSPEPREAKEDDTTPHSSSRRGKRNTEEVRDRVTAGKHESREEWSKHHQQQQAREQGKKKADEEQQEQRAEWKQQQQQHGGASEEQAPQKNRKDICSFEPRSGSRDAYAASETEEGRQQQWRRAELASEEAAAEIQDAASVETRTLEMRRSVDEEMKERTGKQEEQQQHKEKEEEQTGEMAAETRAERRALDKSCSSGHVPSERGEKQPKEATDLEDDTAAMYRGRGREEKEGDSTQQAKHINGYLRQDGEKTRTITTAGWQDEQVSAATAAATVVAATGEDGKSAAERKGEARRRNDEVGSEKGDTRVGEVERAVLADEAASTKENEYAARAERNAAGDGQQKKEEVREVGGKGTRAAAEQEEESETPATKECSSTSTARRHVQQTADRSRDAFFSIGEIAAGEEEAAESKASVDSHSLRRPPAVTQSSDSCSATNGRSRSADGMAAATDRVQSYEKEAGVGAAARDTTAAAAVAQASSPAPAHAPDAEAVLRRGGAGILEGEEESEGTRTSTVAQQEGEGRRQDKEVARNSRLRPVDGGDADGDAAAELEEKTESSLFHEATDAGGRGERTFSSSKGGSSLSATAGAAAEVAEEREHTEAGDKGRTTTGGTGAMHHSHGSWRVVTLDSYNRNDVGGNRVKTTNRESSSSGSSSASSGGGGDRGAEGPLRPRGRDEEERREKVVGEERRRRICYHTPAPYPSPLQKHMPVSKHSQRSQHIVPHSSSFSLRHNYSPTSRPYSPTRDLSPGPCAAPPSAAYNKSNYYYRTVHFPPGAYGTPAVSNSRAAPFPRPAVAAPSPFAPLGSGAADAVWSRRGEELALLQMRSATGPSPGIRYGMHGTAPAAHLAAAPQARPRLAQQQHQQQDEIKDNWNPFPAAASTSFPLLRMKGRLPMGEAPLSKFGAAKDSRRKENLKWTHDLFEQVAREPEKPCRRFNLYHVHHTGECPAISEPEINLLRALSRPRLCVFLFVCLHGEQSENLEIAE